LSEVRALIREHGTTKGTVVECVQAAGVKPAKYGLHEIPADIAKWPEALLKDVASEFGFLMDAGKGGDA